MKFVWRELKQGEDKSLAKVLQKIWLLQALHVRVLFS